MWLASWFERPRRGPQADRPGRARRPAAQSSPRVEALEARCLFSAGPLDPTFGSGGIVTSVLGSGSFAYATALQSDGKILAAGQATVAKGNQFALARYTTNGSLDSTFGSGGKVTTKVAGGSARALAIQPGDGKIVLGGDASFGLARYTTGGSLDTSFGSRGIKTIAFPGSLGDDEVEALAIQADGKILAAGTSEQNNPAVGNFPQWEFALARYNANGSLDTSFGSGGTVLTNFGNNAPYGADVQAYINAIALQPDGKIVVAGSVNNGVVGVGGTFTVARYNVNGTLDTTFGPAGTGVVYVSTNLLGGANSVAIQSDGRIIAAGGLGTRFSPGQWALVRFNANGSLDGTFGSGGEVTVTVVPGSGAADSAFGVALLAGGKIVVAGTHDVAHNFNQTCFTLGRFNSDGSLDTTFNGTGLVTTSIGTAADGRGVLIQPIDGKVVVAGGASVNGVSSFALARYLANGPQIGSFTASPNPVPAGNTLTLTVQSITDPNPSANITQVGLYADSNGDGKLEPGSDTLLGYATQTSPGVWTFTFATTGWAPGNYTLFAQAEDNYGLFSDPLALLLTVQ
jgi:uncharacterized delta-60 repeat protein